MARDRDKDDEMVEWLFANQPTLTELGMRGGTGAADAIKAQAQTMLGVTDSNAEYAKKLPDVQRDIADGGALNVTSTPTFFINGVRATDGQGKFLPPQYFDLAIKLELSERRRSEIDRAWRRSFARPTHQGFRDRLLASAAASRRSTA